MHCRRAAYVGDTFSQVLMDHDECLCSCDSCWKMTLMAIEKKNQVLGLNTEIIGWIAILRYQQKGDNYVELVTMDESMHDKTSSDNGAGIDHATLSASAYSAVSDYVLQERRIGKGCILMSCCRRRRVPVLILQLLEYDADGNREAEPGIWSEPRNDWMDRDNEISAEGRQLC